MQTLCSYATHTVLQTIQHQYTPTHLGNTTVMAVSIGAQFGSPHWTSWTDTITPSRMGGGMSMSDHSSTRAIPAVRSATACGSSAGCPGINMAYCVGVGYQGVRDSSIGLGLGRGRVGLRPLATGLCVAGRDQMRGHRRPSKDRHLKTGEKFGRRDWRVAGNSKSSSHHQHHAIHAIPTLNPNRFRIEPPPSYIDDELPRRIYREGLGCREISPKIRRRRSEFRHGLLRHLIDVRKFKFLAGKGDRSRRRARYVYVYALSSSIAYFFSPLLNSWTRVGFEPQAKYSSMMFTHAPATFRSYLLTHPLPHIHVISSLRICAQTSQQ